MHRRTTPPVCAAPGAGCGRRGDEDMAHPPSEALEAAGTKPTVRAVADALSASGQFMPVSPSTVHRWQKGAWRAVGKAGRPKSVANAPDLAAMALSGDPTSTRKDIVARADAEEVERLRDTEEPLLFPLLWGGLLPGAILLWFLYGNNGVPESPEVARSWKAQLVATMLRNKRYPESARSSGEQGSRPCLFQSRSAGTAP